MKLVPALIAVQNAAYWFVPEDCENTTVSPIAMLVQLTVNVAGVVDPAAAKSVMAPVGVFEVTPVVRDVSWVTAVPTPDPAR